MAVIPDVSFSVAELSKFSDNPAKCHYVTIKRVVRNFRQDPEKGIIWWRKEQKITLPVGSIISKVYMDTQIPGAIKPFEALT